MDTIETIRNEVNKLRLKLAGITCPICQSEFEYPVKKYILENRTILGDSGPEAFHSDLHCLAGICKNCGFVSLHCYARR